MFQTNIVKNTYYCTRQRVSLCLTCSWLNCQRCPSPWLLGQCRPRWPFIGGDTKNIYHLDTLFLDLNTARLPALTHAYNLPAETRVLFFLHGSKLPGSRIHRKLFSAQTSFKSDFTHHSPTPTAASWRPGSWRARHQKKPRTRG